VSPARLTFLGLPIDGLDMDETVRRCEELIEQRAGAQHVCLNAAKVVAVEHDERLRDIVRECELVSADGQSVVWAARLLGRRLPERVAGIDLMHRLLALAEERGYRVFILGSKREVLDEAVRRLLDEHPRLEIAGTRDGYFTDAENDEVCAEIRAARPHILLVAISSPKKEYWLAEHGRKLEVPLLVGVGGAIDVVAGVTRRAPAWMQRAGLEWFFRFLQEPRRLARRYVVTNIRFALLVGRALASRSEAAR
jgi:N-acetylglucosaminyldiphosphoundecaprenol N-acetyl-beta-D-mannosaminyltransferase